MQIQLTFCFSCDTIYLSHWQECYAQLQGCVPASHVTGDNGVICDNP